MKVIKHRGKHFELENKTTEYIQTIAWTLKKEGKKRERESIIFTCNLMKDLMYFVLKSKKKQITRIR